jgi:hypothetical protein
MYSSVLTRIIFKSWSVPMNVPMNTRLSVVVIRRVVVSRDLSAVIDGHVLLSVLEGDIDGESNEDDPSKVAITCK